MILLVDLRKLAKGQKCQVRLSGICNFDPATTVLAHVRKGGVAGVALKPPDLCGVHACSNCHDAIDGRNGNRAVSDSDLLAALCRTLAVVSKHLD